MAGINEIESVEVRVDPEDAEALQQATMAAVKDAKKMLREHRDLVLFGENRTKMDRKMSPGVQCILMARDMFLASESMEDQAKWLTLLMGGLSKFEDRALDVSKTAGNIVTKLTQLKLMATKLNAHLLEKGHNRASAVKELPLAELEALAAQSNLGMTDGPQG